MLIHCALIAEASLRFKLVMEVLMRPNDIYKFKALLPEDYCLIPGNGAIKLVDLP